MRNTTMDDYTEYPKFFLFLSIEQTGLLGH